MLKNFRTYQISKSFYQTCQTLKLPRHLRDQLSRASSSVCLNIAEGAGRQSKADQRRFYAIAFGSLRESQAILDLEVAAGHQAVGYSRPARSSSLPLDSSEPSLTAPAI